MLNTTHIFRIAAAWLTLSIGGQIACEGDGEVRPCEAAALVERCTLGDAVIGDEANALCGGRFDSNLVTARGSVIGQCHSDGDCELLCLFARPCTCGVVVVDGEATRCSECPDQHCGDRRCEGTEQLACEAGASGCAPCAIDCGGEPCGDGACAGTENAETCDLDCGPVCAPGQSFCFGTFLSTCAADGHTFVDFDCATDGEICIDSACVEANVCGNGLCERDESSESCAADCARLCEPARRGCVGTSLFVCAPDGRSQSETDCAADGGVCNDSQCWALHTCGNGMCERDEGDETMTCPRDCIATCGDRICADGERTTCPQDCD